MSRPELFLEHKREGHTPRHLRLTAKRKTFLIGSSKEADLRIGGESIDGCHAVLQFKSPHWYVRSLSLDGAPVTLNGEPVVEAVVDGTASIAIGGNKIELFSRERTTPLFNETTGETTGALSLHQVVISRKGKVLDTRVLSAGETFKFFDGEKTIDLTSPTSRDWKETTIGQKVIRQRLVSAQELVGGEGLTFDRDMRKPLALALLLMLTVIGSVVMMPKGSNKTEAVLDQKSIDMIFNADAIKKKRTESKKVVQSAKRKAGGTADAPVANIPAPMPEQSMAPTRSAKATAAMTSLRNAGLSALVGKIAKRANTNGIMVAAQGVSPDVKGSGRAFFSNGTSTTGGGGAAAVAGDSYRLGGIATRGKGGGASGVRDGTALAGGTVGTGDVAMVDEETVIEGGLDRDVIADVIKRNLGQIRYCYERQLSSNPELYGKLLVKFVIDADGGVIQPKIDTSTLKSAMVEGCVLRRMAGWKFPLPKGGTQVRVSYPFLFKALD